MVLQFNLKNQLVQEQKSLWRVREFYLKDSRTEDEKTFWETLAQQKEDAIVRIQNLIV